MLEPRKRCEGMIQNFVRRLSRQLRHKSHAAGIEVKPRIDQRAFEPGFRAHWAFRLILRQDICFNFGKLANETHQ